MAIHKTNLVCLGLNFFGDGVIILLRIIGMFLGIGPVGVLFGVGIALLPLIFSVGVAGVIPTDISGMDMSDLGGFDGSFSVHPANGIPMIGGMGGIDIFGHSFGTDFNDPN